MDSSVWGVFDLADRRKLSLKPWRRRSKTREQITLISSKAAILTAGVAFKDPVWKESHLPPHGGARIAAATETQLSAANHAGSSCGTNCSQPAARAPGSAATPHSGLDGRPDLIPTLEEGWSYLAAEMDVCSKLIAGWKPRRFVGGTAGCGSFPAGRQALAGSGTASFSSRGPIRRPRLAQHA
jgi:hypothetical protein